MQAAEKLDNKLDFNEIKPEIMDILSGKKVGNSYEALEKIHKNILNKGRKAKGLVLNSFSRNNTYNFAIAYLSDENGFSFYGYVPVLKLPIQVDVANVEENNFHEAVRDLSHIIEEDYLNRSNEILKIYSYSQIPCIDQFLKNPQKIYQDKMFKRKILLK